MRGFTTQSKWKLVQPQSWTAFSSPMPRIEEQLPRGAGDDERQRQRIEIERAQDAFAADLLIEQDREQQAEREAEDDIETAEDPHIDDRRVPVRRRVALEGPGPELLIIRPADEIEIGERLGVRERKQQRPEIEAVDEEQDRAEKRARERVSEADRAAGRASRLGAERSNRQQRLVGQSWSSGFPPAERV